MLVSCAGVASAWEANNRRARTSTSDEDIRYRECQLIGREGGHDGAGTQAIYEELLNVAKCGGTTNYSCIAPLAKLDMASPADRNLIAGILDSISRAEHQAGRPLLSAVVVLKDENIPGGGFFELAKRLGLYGGNDDVQYWVKEVRRVHDHWEQQVSGC